MHNHRLHPLLGLIVCAGSLTAAGPSAAQPPVLTDSLYLGHHPRLLFSNDEIPALRAKVQDGGVDDEDYDFVVHMVRDVYSLLQPSAVLGAFFGLETMGCFGLVAHIEPDAAVTAQGKLLTTFIADNYNVDFDEASSGMRLRSLALGYDLFFADATEAERATIRDEIVLYIQRMIWTNNYKAFEYRPYLGNHSAMFGAALGLAAIGLQGEADPVILSDAMAMADRIVANLLEHQFDPGGTYNEGGLYSLWTLRNLIYYFDARKRFDGFAFSDLARLRAVETWLPYELLSEGSVFTHNLNDSPLVSAPFARNATYFDWALGEWNSGLASWLREHTIGTYGLELGMSADKAATILWYRDVPPLQPDLVLPRSRVWEQRGLYHFRTGWQTEHKSTDDVLFNLYSGKFQGGHAQEDQNQFALYAYGAKFAIDHGSGGVGKESESHNIVFVDGKGQHNAGSSIGTDGRIAEYLLGGFADYVMADATQAYGTYSEFNAPGVPFPGTDWSWGYKGANPVLAAYRRVLVVHGEPIPPYVVVMDDINKDDTPHAYEWRLHTHTSNTVSTASNPWLIDGSAAMLDVHVLHPSPDSLAVTTELYDNLNSDPNSKLIRAATTAIDPRFSFLMIPRKYPAPASPVTQQSHPWGYACAIDGGGGVVDYVLRNDSGTSATDGHITTDALIAWVREMDGEVVGYLATGAHSLAVGGIDHVTLYDGPATCEMSGSTVHLDRDDADFRFFDTGIAKVVCRGQPLPFVARDGYVVSEGVSDVGAVRARSTLLLAAHPNPFNPSATIRVDAQAGQHVLVAVYDVTGRRVRRLWNAALPGSSQRLLWDGRDDGGRRVASGTYFVRATAGTGSRTIKLTLLK